MLASVYRIVNTSTTEQTLTLTVSAPGQPIALRLHWLDSPCCKSFYGNEPNFSWQWWGVAQHPVPDAGVCRESALAASSTGSEPVLACVGNGSMVALLV
eukprot:COSAG02_NODE_12590_length_1522_cov_1.115249_1_plen_99_part_00